MPARRFATNRMVTPTAPKAAGVSSSSKTTRCAPIGRSPCLVRKSSSSRDFLAASTVLGSASWEGSSEGSSPLLAMPARVSPIPWPWELPSGAEQGAQSRAAWRCRGARDQSRKLWLRARISRSGSAATASGPSSVARTSTESSIRSSSPSSSATGGSYRSAGTSAASSTRCTAARRSSRIASSGGSRLSSAVRLEASSTARPITAPGGHRRLRSIATPGCPSNWASCPASRPRRRESRSASSGRTTMVPGGRRRGGQLGQDGRGVRERRPPLIGQRRNRQLPPHDGALVVDDGEPPVGRPAHLRYRPAAVRRGWHCQHDPAPAHVPQVDGADQLRGGDGEYARVR